MSEIKFTLGDLQGRTYRDLQQLAKSLGLPSNVKKVYLIQLIHAKKFRSPEEVEAIVHQVKLERRQTAQVRKRVAKNKAHLQGAEISSTSNSQSPPIGHTPRRPGQIIVSSPEVHHAMVKYPRQSVMRSTYIKKTYPSVIPTSSDRVLRSFSMKSKQPSALLSLLKNQSPVSLNEGRMDIMSQEKSYLKTNVMATCLVKKQRPQMQSNRVSLLERLRGQILPVSNRMNLCPIPARRQRVLSGIYPITTVTKEAPKVNYEYIQSIGFRRSDGTMSHINALIQKSTNEQPAKVEITVQDLIDSNVESQNLCNATASSEYPNMSSVMDYGVNYQRQSNQLDLLNRSSENQGMSSVYYHKKIRAEQVRTHKRPGDDHEDRLPKISEVFSKFNEVHGRDVTQPIYIQVSDEAERILNYPIYSRANSTNMLESLYNFKSSFLVNQPLLQVATTASTKCVFSTHVVASAVAQPSATDAYYVPSCEQASQTESGLNTRMCDLFNMADQEPARRDHGRDHVEELSTSDSSIERANSQEVETSTIPEMVEDALEIISQDGDYMERIGMDVRVQCILCSWAGPRFALECHIRKDHASLVLCSAQSSWHVSFPLGAVLRGARWCSRVVAHRAQLYVLSASGHDATAHVALATVSSDLTPKTGYMTVYNKLTGEPHIWTGEIQPLSPNMPYYTEASCLKLDISRLNLIPNSANLKLVNGELVVRSPNKVIVGIPNLDDINVTVFVKIFDSVV